MVIWINFHLSFVGFAYYLFPQTTIYCDFIQMTTSLGSGLTNSFGWYSDSTRSPASYWLNGSLFAWIIAFYCFTTLAWIIKHLSRLITYVIFISLHSLFIGKNNDALENKFEKIYEVESSVRSLVRLRYQVRIQGKKSDGQALVFQAIQQNRLSQKL